jgi:hypothetical protein
MLTLSKALLEKMAHAPRYGVGIDKINHAIAFVPHGKDGYKLYPSNFSMRAGVSKAIPCGHYIFQREESVMFICILEEAIAPLEPIIT